MKVVIVGGVAGGASAAARLRRLCEDAEILMLEKDEYISYANCGLPYYIGGEITDREDLKVQTPEDFQKRFNVQVRTQTEVLAVDAAAKTVRLKDLRTGKESNESWDKLLLAPGAQPVRPPMEGLDDPRVFTLRTLGDTFRIAEFIEAEEPETAVIIGGGFIGLEMAENLARRGVQVSLVEMAGHLLPPFDLDMAEVVHRHMEERGVELFLGCAVRGLAAGQGGLAVRLEKGELPADMVLLSVGVKPDTAFLQNSGIQLNERGAIVVDERMRTSLPDVYAVGDAVETFQFVSGRRASIPLAGPANKQGRIAADNLGGIPTAYKGTQGSAVVRAFELTAACTGLNERAAKEAGFAFDKVYLQANSHAGYYPGAEPMALKLLFEKDTGKILGAQLVGRDGVDKRCDVLATAMRAGLGAAELTELELCYAPPYSSAKDPVNMAGYVAENLLAGRVRQYYWEDLEKLPKDGSVTLLDVRTDEEFERAHAQHFVHIPLDELRGRRGELDSKKPVYITCQSGLRSYIACRILEQHGFTCYNFAGGYRLYDILNAMRRGK